MKFEDWTELYLGGFEAMELWLGGIETLLIGIEAFEDSNTVSGVTLTLTGGFEVGPVGSFLVPITGISGDMSFTDNVVNVTTVTGNVTRSLVVVQNPPPYVKMLLEAGAWPTPKNGSYVKIWASWR